jgi:hypothetical protein
MHVSHVKSTCKYNYSGHTYTAVSRSTLGNMHTHYSCVNKYTEVCVDIVSLTRTM